MLLLMLMLLSIRRLADCDSSRIHATLRPSSPSPRRHGRRPATANDISLSSSGCFLLLLLLEPRLSRRPRHRRHHRRRSLLLLPPSVRRHTPLQLARRSRDAPRTTVLVGDRAVAASCLLLVKLVLVLLLLGEDANPLLARQSAQGEPRSVRPRRGSTLLVMVGRASLSLLSRREEASFRWERS